MKVIIFGSIETKWNDFNLIRTITSAISFILLLITCFLIAEVQAGIDSTMHRFGMQF